MIDEHSIRVKDFSIELPQIIAKIEFLSTVLAYNEDDLIPVDFTEGLGAILAESAEDLRIINKALYKKEDVQLIAKKVRETRRYEERMRIIEKGE